VAGVAIAMNGNVVIAGLYTLDTRREFGYVTQLSVTTRDARGHAAAQRDRGGGKVVHCGDSRPRLVSGAAPGPLDADGVRRSHPVLPGLSRLLAGDWKSYSSPLTMAGGSVSWICRKTGSTGNGALATPTMTSVDARPMPAWRGGCITA
jgi:hypothetical protein